jgi:hypothetical protein
MGLIRIWEDMSTPPRFLAIRETAADRFPPALYPYAVPGTSGAAGLNRDQSDQ